MQRSMRIVGSATGLVMLTLVFLLVAPALMAWPGAALDARELNDVQENKPVPAAVMEADPEMVQPEPLDVPQTGWARHGAYITVPSGTVNDWVLFVSPRTMGAEESNSEADNSILVIECWANPINQYTWQIWARYKFKWWNDNPRNGYWYSGTANYLLVPKHP